MTPQVTLQHLVAVDVVGRLDDAHDKGDDLVDVSVHGLVERRIDRHHQLADVAATPLPLTASESLSAMG